MEEKLTRNLLQHISLNNAVRIGSLRYTGELGYDGLNGTREMVRPMQNPSFTYDEYLICIGLGPSISSVICKNPSYSDPSYPSSPVIRFCRFGFATMCNVLFNPYFSRQLGVIALTMCVYH